MTILSCNPHEPSDVVLRATASDPTEVAEAVSRSCAAFNEWAWVSRPDRTAVLRSLASLVEQRSDDLVQLVVREIGKPLGEARSEVARGAEYFRYYAALADMPSGSTYEPTAVGSLLYTRQ